MTAHLTQHKMTVKILSLLLVGTFVFTVRGNDEATTPAAEVVVEQSTAGQQQQSPIVEAIIQKVEHNHLSSADEVSATTTASETHSPTEAMVLATTENEEEETENSEDTFIEFGDPVLIAFMRNMMDEILHPRYFQGTPMANGQPDTVESPEKYD